MKEESKDKLIFFLIGVLIGILVTVFGGLKAYQIVKNIKGGGSVISFGSSGSESGGSDVPFRKEFHLSFESKEDLKVLQPAGGATTEIVSQNATDGDKALLLKIPSGSKYPGLQWEVYGKKAQNWTGAEKFHLDIYNNTEDYVRIHVKFKSGKNYPKKSYEYYTELNPLQMNKVDIPIGTIANMCDIKEMSYVKIFVANPRKNIALYLDNVGTQ